MTDQRLRDLKRDAARGDLQAQALLLLERVRVGDLAEERLRLAAYLGDEAARLARSAIGTAACVDVADLEAYGREVVERACVATVRLLVPYWRGAFPQDLRIPSAVERAEHLILGVVRREKAASIEGLGSAEHDAARVLPDGLRSGQALAAVAVDYAFAGVLFGNMGVRVVAGHAHRALRLWLAVSEDEAGRRIHDAIAAEVVPWALGVRDPLRERLGLGAAAAPVLPGAAGAASP